MITLLRISKSHVLRLAALAVNVGLGLGGLGLWFVACAQKLTWRADFTAFYTGWSLVVNGLGERLYDYELQTATQQQILGGRHLAGGLLAFNYPPHVALLFAPLAYLSLEQAYLVWSVLQLAALAWLCWVLSKHLKSEGVGVTTSRLVISAAMAVPAVGVTLLLGAFSTLMLLCLLNFALALRRNNDLKAALWVALMAIKPQVAVVPGLVLVAARRWKAVGGAVVCGLVIFAATTLALGRGVWLDFAGVLVGTFGADEALGVTPSDMVNLRGMLVSLFGDGSVTVVNAVSLVAFLVSLLLVLGVWSGARAKSLDFDLRMSATLLLGILFCPHTNPQDGVLLVGPALFFWDYLRRTGQSTVLYSGFVLTCPLLFWITERVLPTTVKMPVIAMFALGVWMLRSYRAGDIGHS